jgi:hypothetical protein
VDSGLRGSPQSLNTFLPAGALHAPIIDRNEVHNVVGISVGMMERMEHNLVRMERSLVGS